MRSIGRVAREKGDVRRAEEEIADIQQEIRNLEQEIEQRINEVAADYSIERYEMETFGIKPRRSDIFDVRVALLWEMVA